MANSDLVFFYAISLRDIDTLCYSVFLFLLLPEQVVAEAEDHGPVVSLCGLLQEALPLGAASRPCRYALTGCWQYLEIHQFS